ncbi:MULTISPECIES: 3-keto-5-aminohexanoate cleavage protein [unclassified Mesorhizobium]|uniref:3-keto-5-aminohexanoate cleavage protein n=1 Tax=unclassified Mesorhizobium TaxID=325217 RepID=UPI00333B5649
MGHIRHGCDALLSVTTGGSEQMSVEERLEAPIRLPPELCPLNVGRKFRAAPDGIKRARMETLVGEVVP